MRKPLAYFYAVVTLSGILSTAHAATVPASAPIATLSDAVNEGGMQRARTYKLLKYYLQIQTHNAYQNPAEALARVSGRFEETQKRLERYAADDPILLEAFRAVDRKWAIYKKQLATPCSASKAIGVLDQAVALKGLAHQAVKALLAAGEGSGAKEVNQAGLFRAQSQKLASLYLIKAWIGDPAPEHLAQEMDKAMKGFRSSLDFLEQSPLTTPEMRPLLNKMGKTYLYFSVMNNSSVFTPTLVLKKTDAMLANAVKLVELYVRASKK